MFHPVIVTLCFSVIYLISHIYPTSATLTLHHNCSTQSIINQTATAQFDSLNIIPISFILSSPRTQVRPTGNIFLSILILLSGDILSNPGPISTNSRLNMCTLNIRSLTTLFIILLWLTWPNLKISRFLLLPKHGSILTPLQLSYLIIFLTVSH